MAGKRLFLIDGYSNIFRAYYAIMAEPCLTPDGVRHPLAQR